MLMGYLCMLNTGVRLDAELITFGVIVRPDHVRAPRHRRYRKPTYSRVLNINEMPESALS
jgi:hypothetical protein